MAIPLPLQCGANRLELGVWLQGTALAYSLLKDLGFIPSIVFSFSTNKQTTSLILTDSSHLEHSHTNSGSAKAMRVFYECDRLMKRIPLAHSPLQVLTALLSYLLGTREISLRVAKSPLKQK